MLQKFCSLVLHAVSGPTESFESNIDSWRIGMDVAITSSNKKCGTSSNAQLKSKEATS